MLRMNGLDTASVRKAITSAAPVILFTDYAGALGPSDIASADVTLFPKTAPIDGLATEIENLLPAS